MITLLIFGLIAGTTLAAKGGNAGGNNHGTATTCEVHDNVVSATGLPVDEVINFMVTDGTGTSGWALGFTWDGTWSVTVADRTGPTTYEFAGRTFGKDGAKYTVFASCGTAS